MAPSARFRRARRRSVVSLLVVGILLLLQVPAHAFLGGLLSTPETSSARAITDVADGELHVMSFNVHQATSAAPPWRQRRPAMRALLRQEAPHLIGTQEAMPAQARDIAFDLGLGYRALAQADGMNLPQLTIYYDWRRLRLVESGAFSLSSSPETQGTRSWGETVPRHALWARFRDRQTKQLFVAVNTHLEHGIWGSYPRAQAAALIRERMSVIAGGQPVVVTGDFNERARPESSVHDTLVGSGWTLDTWEHAESRGEETATYGGYAAPSVGAYRIDWVLASAGTTVRTAAINTFALDGQYPSDHFPVQAVLVLGHGS